MSDQGLSIFDNPSEDNADEPTQVIPVGTASTEKPAASAEQARTATATQTATQTATRTPTR